MKIYILYLKLLNFEKKMNEESNNLSEIRPSLCGKTISINPECKACTENDHLKIHYSNECDSLTSCNCCVEDGDSLCRFHKEMLKEINRNLSGVSDNQVKTIAKKIRNSLGDNNGDVKIAEDDRYNTFKKKLKNGYFNDLSLPEGEPRFLEKHSSLVIQNNIVWLLTALTSLFNQEGVDFEFIKDNCYFKCSYVHSNYYQLNFHVYLYLLPDDTILIEYQRRSGEVIQFMELFSDAIKQIRDREQPVPKEVQWKSEIPTIVSENIFQCLRNMMDSDFTDIRFEGIRYIAFLSINSNNVEPMIEQGIVALLTKMMEEDEEKSIRRCAVTTVANLAGNEYFNTEIIKKGGLSSICQFVNSLIEKIEIYEMESLREAARALLGLIQNF